MRYHRWDYYAETEEIAVVLPDGCLDILLLSQPGGGQNILCCRDWDLRPRTVTLSAGSAITGFRLRPGTTVHLDRSNGDFSDVTKLEQCIDALIAHDEEVEEIIEALGQPDGTLESLAKSQGVSSRTLQRHFSRLSLPSPGFWRLLGRARNAAQALALPGPLPLCDIAVASGYSDQAHMTREFLRWFALTPLQIRKTPTVLGKLSQPGLGNWGL